MNELGFTYDYKVNISFEITNGTQFNSIIDILEFELQNLSNSSSKINYFEINPVENNKVNIYIKTVDFISFKIAMNAILKYIEIIKKTIKIIDR